ncbi:hypothetical protein ABEF95_011899 [Exophiala dermatitidis]
MAVWEKVLKVVGGRALAEKSEQKRLEREYEDAAAALKLITVVANEPRIEYPVSRPSSIYSNPIPERRKPTERTLHPPKKPVYERCASSPVIPVFAKQPTLAGPPDITARDLNSEDLKRNYSCDNVWNVKDQPLPPLPQMTGFGRYRRAVNASVEWQLEHLHHNLHDMGAVIVNHLGDCPPAGLDPETWQGYRARHSRASSTASSRSSSSGPAVTTPAVEYLDTATGTRVSRGFFPSATSSAASSLKDGSGYYRRDSNMSKPNSTSPASDGDTKYKRRPVSRGSPYRHTSTTSMSPLTAISETQEAHHYVPRKIEKPCEFDEDGDAENAVASDDDDEFDCDWTDMLEVGGGANTSNLTRGLERISSARAMGNARLALTRQRTNSSERPRSRAAKRAVPDRSKTIKAVTRPAQRRILSRKQSDTAHAVQAAILQQTQGEETLKHEAENGNGNGRGRSTAKVSAQPENPSIAKPLSKAGNQCAAEQKSIVAVKDGQATHDTLSPASTLQLPARGNRERSSTVLRIQRQEPQLAHKATENKAS